MEKGLKGKKNNYIDKIIKIGKKESCTKQELLYFLPNLPDIGNKELLRTLREDYRISTDHITRREFLALNPLIHKRSRKKTDGKLLSFITDLIKGIHLIETKCHRNGSTTAIFNLLYSLIAIDVNKAIELYDWIAFNGGNYYIKENRTFMEEAGLAKKVAERKREEEIRLDNIHTEAVIRKQKNRDDHQIKTQEHREKRNAEISKLSKLDMLQQLKSIVNSDYPLGLYPDNFSNIDIKLVAKLSVKEEQNLKEKLKSVKRGPWKLWKISVKKEE